MDLWIDLQTLISWWNSTELDGTNYYKYIFMDNSFCILDNDATLSSLFNPAIALKVVHPGFRPQFGRFTSI